jgi:hypothetical protein
LCILAKKSKLETLKWDQSDLENPTPIDFLKDAGIFLGDISIADATLINF